MWTTNLIKKIKNYELFMIDSSVELVSEDDRVFSCLHILWRFFNCILVLVSFFLHWLSLKIFLLNMLVRLNLERLNSN